MTPRIVLMPLAPREDHAARAARRARWVHRLAIAAGIFWGVALVAGAAGFAYALSP